MQTSNLLFSVCSACCILFFLRSSWKKTLEHNKYVIALHCMIIITWTTDGTAIAGGQKHNVWRNSLVPLLLVLAAFLFPLNDFQTQT